MQALENMLVMDASEMEAVEWIQVMERMEAVDGVDAELKWMWSGSRCWKFDTRGFKGNIGLDDAGSKGAWLTTGHVRTILRTSFFWSD